MSDSFGPIPREEFKKLADAPHGKATEIIRRYDPEWGREPGEQFDWTVQATRRTRGTATVKAASQEEANDMADNLKEGDFDWDCWDDDFDILSVEPARR